MIGRGGELAQVMGLLDDARTGTAGVLVVAGEAGIGKTTVLEAAVEAADGLRVARLVGVQAERDIPWSGLHALLGPLLDEVTTGALAPPAYDALQVVLGLTTGPTPGPLLVGTAVLGVVSAAEPLLLVVDDLQWVDAPSAGAIAFAARRLVAERVAVLLGLRTGDAPDELTVAAGLPRLELGGIDEPDELLPGLHPAVASVLVDATGGNPLAMLEAAAVLTDDEAQGVVALPRVLPPTRPERAYEQRLAELDPDTRSVARLLALAGAAPRDVVGRALAGGGHDLARIDPLVETGLCRFDGTAHWRHPLARAAAARGGPAEVREAHRLLAEAWGGAATPARAWHRAEATSGPDDAVAAELAVVAETAEARDASADAADAWERAAMLVTDHAHRAALGERAARAALRSGSTRRAAALIDDALLGQPGAEAAARLLWQRGRIQHGLGDPARGLELFVQAVGLSRDPALRVWAAAEGLYAAMYAGRPDQATRMAEIARAHHDPADPVQSFLVAHTTGAAHALNGRPKDAREAMAPVRVALGEGLLDREPELLLWAVNVELFDPLELAVPDDVWTAMDRVRASGDLTWWPRVLHLVSGRERGTGRWGLAVALLEECELAARLSGQETQLLEALVGLAEIDALRGDVGRATARLEEAATLADRVGVSWLDAFRHWVAALVAQVTGDVDGATAHLRAAVADQPTDLWLLVDHVLQHQGRKAAMAELTSHAAAPAPDRELAAALLALDETVAAHRLVALADDNPVGVESAIARLAAGSRLRRAGFRRAAREQLRGALAVLDGVGARPWAERAEAELRASGATLRRNDPGTALTPSEERVARVAAEGRSTREVATVLFLSPKTVEFHLGNVYRKLGVANRVELARALTGEG